MPVLLSLLLLAACRKGGNGEPSPGASASAGASADCAALAAAICEKSGGADSQHCLSIRDLETLLPPSACAVANSEHAHTTLTLAAERKPCTDLVERLCKDIGTETESCKMVRARTRYFPPAQCVSMTNNYANVLDELRRNEEKAKPLDAQKRAALVDSPRAVSGSKDAKAKLVVFSDFQCPFCAKSTTSLDAVRRTFGDRVYVVFRQFPIPFHEDAPLAAEAALAAAAQGKFWEFHDKVFANQTAIKRENLVTYARDVGLDVAKFEHALDRGTYKAAVDAELALGKTVNVEGTPTAFLNGKVVANLSDTPALLAAVQTELDR